MQNLIEIKLLTDDHLQEHIQKNTTSTAWHRFLQNILLDNKKEEVMQLAPIPAFLVYDGLASDLQAKEVYKHLLSLADQTPPWANQARVFLCTCVVKQKICDPKAHINQAMYLCMVPLEAKQWAS
eukprot:5448236-Ditylum_brightwellii.AAC.1